MKARTISRLHCTHQKDKKVAEDRMLVTQALKSPTNPKVHKSVITYDLHIHIRDLINWIINQHMHLSKNFMAAEYNTQVNNNVLIEKLP